MLADFAAGSKAHYFQSGALAALVFGGMLCSLHGSRISDNRSLFIDLCAAPSALGYPTPFNPGLTRLSNDWFWRPALKTITSATVVPAALERA